MTQNSYCAAILDFVNFIQFCEFYANFNFNFSISFSQLFIDTYGIITSVIDKNLGVANTASGRVRPRLNVVITNEMGIGLRVQLFDAMANRIFEWNKMENKNPARIGLVIKNAKVNHWLQRVSIYTGNGEAIVDGSNKHPKIREILGI